MHIGQLIKQKMEEEGKTVSWLARNLSYCRTNVYKIYDKKSIDTDLLMRISALLELWSVDQRWGFSRFKINSR